jgi:DNA-binding response OmpR family regulator
MDIATRRAPTPPSGDTAAPTPPLARPTPPDPRGQALARAAQELKAPLAVIKGSATTLLADPDRWDSATRHEMLRLIDGQVDRLHDLVNHLLDIWRLDAAHLPIQVEPVSPETLIGELAERAQSRAPDHRFTLAVSGDLTPLGCDAARIARALDHLVAYLLRDAPDRVIIEIEARPAPDGTPGASLLIRRGGPSPSPEALAALFEPFGAPATPHTRSTRGHAPDSAPDSAPDPHLGLAEARAVILAHGGRITAAPPATAPGLEFTITLPAAAPERLPAPATNLAVAMVSRQPRARPVILIASDDPHMARYLRANLETQGYHPVLATAGQLSRLLDLEAPDLVLLDAPPADRAPASVAQTLRECAGLPMIVLGAGGEADCVSALDDGAADYLGKPFAMPELLARVRTTLRQAARPRLDDGADDTFRTGDLTIDYGRREVHMGERLVALSRTEYKLLRALARQAGRVLPHDLLLERVWGPGYGAEVEFLWVYMRRLRRKIEPDPHHPRYLLTVPGVGYRLAQVQP